MNISAPYELIVGLDRSDRTADLHLIHTADGQSRSCSIDTSPEALWEWLLELRQKHPQARLALCLEQPAAHLIAFLEAYSWITLYPINPITLQKYREAFVTSRAKDDAKDARFLAQLLLHHHTQLKPWAPEDSQTRAVQQWAFHRRAVVDERTALTNRLKALLKHYFPQALVLCGEDLWRPLATDFLLRWSTLQAVQKARTATLKAFYHRQGSRSNTLLEQRLALIKRAVAVTDQSAILESFALRAELLCRQLQALGHTLQSFDRQIAQSFQDHPDQQLFSSLPGAGPVLAPRLLASMGSLRERYPKASSLQHYTGVAPVTKQSGGSHRVHRRYLCPKYHRQSFHEYAQQSILHSRWAAAYYLQQRTRGSLHHTAVRALAYKWQRIIWRCWISRSPYQEKIYEAALKRANSPLVQLLDKIEMGKTPYKKSANKN